MSEQPNREPGIARRTHGPIDGGPQVAEFGQQPDASGVRSRPARLVLRGQEVAQGLRVPAQHRFRFAGRGQLLQRERTGRLEQAIARLALPFGDHQRLVDQLGEDVEHLPLVDAFVARDPLRELQPEAARENAEPPEHRPLVVRQQSDAPLERRAQRLVPAQFHTRDASQHVEHLVEARLQADDAEQRDAGGGQLNRQRDAVEAAADVDHRLDVVRAEAEARVDRVRACHEQRHGSVP